MDASDIQVYTINGKGIFYLKPCGKGVELKDIQVQDHHTITHDPKCQTCRKKLNDSNYLFCSIDCKYMMMGCSTMINNIEIGEVEWAKPMRKRKMNTEECCSLLAGCKRSRKGIPSRAPFW